MTVKTEWIISTIDITLQIPPKMRGIFPNEKPLLIPLKKDVPTEVPDYVAKYYTQNRPHVYRLASEPKPEPEKPEKPENDPPKFDPVQWLEFNADNIDEAILQLERKDLLMVGKALNLTGIYQQKTERVQERVINDVKVRQKHEGDLAKLKGAE